MRRVYVALAGLLMLTLVVQFYFAAVGAFDKPQDDDSFALHRVMGRVVIPLLIILTVIAAAIARAPGRLIGLTALPFGLMLVQTLIVVLGRAFNDSGDNTTPVGLAVLGLHALNGLLIMGVVGTVIRRARELAATPAAREVAAAPAQVS